MKNKFKAEPVYLVMLVIAVVFYVAGVCAIHSDLYKKVCALEHKLIHMQGGRGPGCVLEK